MEGEKMAHGPLGNVKMQIDAISKLFKIIDVVHYMFFFTFFTSG